MRQIRGMISFAGVVVLLVVAPVRAPAQSRLADSVVKRIDSVFARFANPAGPGCAVGAYQDGKVVFAKGYGSANLEYGIPITPSTPFIMGSVSKQFTAAAIALLVEQKRLSLNDDVRKYVPELPDYGKTITVGHLVHHTSGLRDFWTLVDVAGMRSDDGYTSDDILRLAARQKHLNFDPGTEYAYSNTGYVVLGIIVKRVTGKSLRDFTAEQIFGPLGMTVTHFHDDHTMTVPGRAYAYSPLPNGGWRVNVWNNDIVGQGGLITSVDELLKWDENFYTGRVGGRGFLARQLERGTLNDGKMLDYAFGLFVSDYRGVPMVDHSGGTGGYRTVLTRFPSLHTSVVALCNTSTADPVTLGRRVADAVLGARFPQPVPRGNTQPAAGQPAASTATPNASDLARLAGRYYSDELDATYEITATDRALVLRRPRSVAADTLRPIDATSFRGAGMVFRFRQSSSGAAMFLIETGRARGMEFVKR